MNQVIVFGIHCKVNEVIRQTSLTCISLSMTISLFLASLDPRSSIVKSVFDCRLSGVHKQHYHHVTKRCSLFSICTFIGGSVVCCLSFAVSIVAQLGFSWL